MTHDIKEDAHAVLLPAFDTLALSETTRRFLSNGGCSILIGESRGEYVAREMSLQRRSTETPEDFLRITEDAAALTGNFLVAVDQEMGGICRLHSLVPSFPPADALGTLSADDIEGTASKVARAAALLGVNCFLSPILDLVTGTNPWLSGRTWWSDPDVVAQYSTAFIKGTQSVGVAAAAKHFPGHHDISGDPAVDASARVLAPAKTFEPGFIPFQEAIRSKVEIVMIGPAVVEAFDPDNPASASAKVISLLTDTFGFGGVVLSDDLDSRATVRAKSVPEVAVESLNAGADLLLLADGDQLMNVVDAICAAVGAGILRAERLARSASKIRALAAKYRTAGL